MRVITVSKTEPEVIIMLTIKDLPTLVLDVIIAVIQTTGSPTVDMITW